MPQRVDCIAYRRQRCAPGAEEHDDAEASPAGEQVPQTIGELAPHIHHSLAQCYAGTAEEIEALTRKQYPEIHIVGGGANAQYLNRLTAEYTGKTVEAGPTEATALGKPAAQIIAEGEWKTPGRREHALRIRLQWRSLKERREKRDDRL